MRKLIEQVQSTSIVCDNPLCDFVIDEQDDIIHFINVRCPKCGEILLTEKDYLQYQSMIKTVKFINRWFSWLTIFYSKKRLNRGKIVSAHVHNGITIKEEI